MGEVTRPVPRPPTTVEDTDTGFGEIARRNSKSLQKLSSGERGKKGRIM